MIRLNPSVRALVTPFGERDQDGGPPGLDGAGEPGRLGQVGVERRRRRSRPAATGSSTAHARASSIRSRSLTAQAAPISLVGSCAVEHGVQPAPLLGRQVLGAGEQQPPVHPHRVGGGAAAAELVAGDALPDLGDHRCWRARPDAICRPRSPRSAARLGSRRRTARTGRSPPCSIRVAELPRSARPATPSRSRRCGQEPTPAAIPARRGSSRRSEVSHGSDRFQLMPSRIQRTDRNRVSSIPSRGRRCRCGQPARRGGDQGLVRGRPGHAVLGGDIGRRPGSRPAIAVATRSRSRSVTRPRGRTAVAGLGERPPRAQRLAARQPAFPPPQLHLLPARRQVLDPAAAAAPSPPRSAPRTLGHGPSRAVCSMITFDRVGHPLDLSTANSCSSRTTLPPGRTTLQVDTSNRAE